MRLTEILRIGRQIAEGLAAAHKQGVIHRDIKPANILLENGVERVKLTDFGLARAIDDITVTRTGEVCGTPQYMSPEQASGERVDHRSDLFSLGCVMYAMCTGHSPFRGDSIAHIIKRVTQDTPRLIADQNPEIPPWLIEIITCLLKKNPECRFQTADALVAILVQHLSRIQHPMESGSHSIINQSLPNVECLHPEFNDGSMAISGSPVEQKGGCVEQRSEKVLVPDWMRSLSRLLFVLTAVGIAFVLTISVFSGFAVVPNEFAIIGTLAGLGPLVMSIILSRPSMNRELMALALFLGLGPFGLLLYLVVKDNLRKALPEPQLPHRKRRGSHLGVILIGIGATLIFCLVAWFLLVAFDIVGAPQPIRRQAGGIASGCLLAAFFLIAAGMIQRKQISGHESWFDFLTLIFYSLLGPIGIFYWVWKGVNRTAEQSDGIGFQTSRERDAVASHLDSGAPTEPNAARHSVPAWLVKPFRLRISNMLLLIGIPLLICSMVGLVSVANNMKLQIASFRPIDPLGFTVVTFGLAAIFLLPALILRLSPHKSPPSTGSLIAWLLIGGPIGVVVWLIERENYNRCDSRSGQSPGKIVTKSNTSVGRPILLLAVLLLGLWSVLSRPAARWIRFTPQLSNEDISKVSNMVAQRFHEPITSVTAMGEDSALVVIPSDEGVQRIYTRRSGGIWELDPAHHATRIEIGKGDTLGPANDEWGGLIIASVDPGNYVAVTGLGPRIFDGQPILVPAGRHKLPVGDYGVIVFDTLAGWLYDIRSSPNGEYEKIYKTVDFVFSQVEMEGEIYDAESGTYTFAQYAAEPSLLRIQPGEFVTVDVDRKLKQIADGSWVFNRKAAERFMPGQFYRFLWNGQKYSFSADQAKAVDILLHAHADGKPLVAETDLLGQIFLDETKRSKNLEDVFNGGKHPAWGNVLVSRNNGNAEYLCMAPLLSGRQAKGHGE